MGKPVQQYEKIFYQEDIENYNLEFDFMQPRKIIQPKLTEKTPQKPCALASLPASPCTASTSLYGC